MKKIILLVLLASALFAEEMCYVTICNKIERFSLNPLAHMGDSIGSLVTIRIYLNLNQMLEKY